MTYLSELIVWSTRLWWMFRELDSDILLQIRDRLFVCVCEIDRELERRQA